MVRRAQVSMEFIFIVGFAMILMISSSYLVYDFTQTTTDQGSLQQVAQIGYRMVDQAANMYVYGSGSFITLSGSMPENIHEVYVVENQTLVFEVQTARGIVPVYIFSQVPINGTDDTGDYVRVPAADSRITPGVRDFKVESQGSWVEISLRQ